MRVVLDTNLIISGVLWGGVPRQILQSAIKQEFESISSEALIDELREVLARSKFQRYIQRNNTTPEKIVADYLSYTTVIEPAKITGDVIRDLKDLKVLEVAVAGNATHIASGDNDLLVLKTYKDIVIVDARQLLDIIESDNTET